jgi:hypothetical protein
VVFGVGKTKYAMKKSINILLVLTSLFLISCHEEQNKKEVISDKAEIYISESAIELKSILFKKVQKESEINVEIALQSIIELYEDSAIDTASNEEPIDLYVIYGVGLWDEYGEDETFQITFAHQAVEHEILYEYRISFNYEPAKFGQIIKFDLRYNRSTDIIEQFKHAVRDSRGFKKALRLSPTKIEIIKEEI